MTTASGVGTSTKRSATEAGLEAARAAVSHLGGARPDLMLVFATTGYDQAAILASVREIAGPHAQISGCSGEGVISQAGSNESAHAVNVMALASTRIVFDAVNIGDFSADPARCGAALAARVRELGPERAKALLVFPEGMKGNCTAFLRALDANLPHRIPIAGGTAGDALRYDADYVMRTHQYDGVTVRNDSVSAVIIGGDMHVDVAVSHGCRPLGLPRTVTRESDGWVTEIDGIPAWTVFKEYLGEEPQDLLSADIVHLCVAEPLPPALAEQYGSPYLIRTPMLLDDKKEGLFFPGGLQLGTKIQFTRRDPELVGVSARKSAEALLQRRADRKPAAVLQFDCCGRGRILFGDRTDALAVTPLQEVLDRTTPWLGFYTFGEIAPIDDRTYFHNYTVVLLALYEAD